MYVYKINENMLISYMYTFQRGGNVAFKKEKRKRKEKKKKRKRKETELCTAMQKGATRCNLFEWHILSKCLLHQFISYLSVPNVFIVGKTTYLTIG